MNLDNCFSISAKRLYERCPRAYFFRYMMGIEPIDLPSPLVRGIEFHQDAEQVYSGSTVDLSEQGEAYSNWANDLEEFNPIFVEFPIRILLRDLAKSVNFEKEMSGDFIGVLDMFATDSAGDPYVVDHKRVSRMYNYPVAYSLEQLILYSFCMELLMDTGPLQLCLSRVRIVSGLHPKHLQNIIYRNLANEGIPITPAGIKSIITNIVTNQENDNIVTSKVKSNVSNKSTVHKYHSLNSKSTYNKSTKVNIHNTIHSKTIKLALSSPSGGVIKLLAVQKRDDQGHLISSQKESHDYLVHVERTFYNPPPEERKRYVINYLDTVLAIQNDKAYRCSCNFECASSGYEPLCRDTLGTEVTPSSFPYSLSHMYRLAPIHKEFREAVKKLQDKSIDKPSET